MLVYVLDDPAAFYRVFATEFPGRKVTILDPVDYIISKAGDYFPNLDHPSVYDKSKLDEVEVAPGLTLAEVVTGIRERVPITAYLRGTCDVLIVTNTIPFERECLFHAGAFIFGQGHDAEADDFAAMLALAAAHMEEYEGRKDA